MPCRAQTTVPTTATGQTCSKASSVNKKLKQLALVIALPSKSFFYVGFNRTTIILILASLPASCSYSITYHPYVQACNSINCPETAGGLVMSCLLSHQPLVPQADRENKFPPVSYRDPSVPHSLSGQRQLHPIPPLSISRAVHFPLVPSFMQGDSSSHFSVRITSSSSDIGKNEHTSRCGDQMWID